MDVIYDFQLPTKVYFGPGTISEIGVLSSQFGKKALIISTRHWVKQKKALEQISRSLLENNVRHLFYDAIKSEPTTKLVNSCMAYTTSEKIDLIIAIGGGSVIDIGKAVSVLVNNYGNVNRYLEVDGSYILKHKGIPFIAIPTTSGTGSEVTRNAVILNTKTKMKRSVRSDLMFPEIAIVDPELTLHLPPQLTALTAMDAFAHLMEGYLSKKANELSELFSLYGISLIKRSLPKAVGSDAGDIKARTDLAMASLMGGFVLTNSGMGICHALSGTLGGMFKVPHSIAVALTLPAVLDYLFDKTEKARKASRILSPGIKTRKSLIPWFKKFYLKSGIKQSLQDFDIQKKHFKQIASLALTSNSIKSSPIKPPKKDLISILDKACSEF